MFIGLTSVRSHIVASELGKKDFENIVKVDTNSTDLGVLVIRHRENTTPLLCETFEVGLRKNKLDVIQKMYEQIASYILR